MNKKISVIIVLLLTISTVFSGCITAEKTDISQKNSLNIITTIFPLYEFSKAVGGDNVEVTLLLPPGTDVHSYDPSAKDIAKTKKADLFVTIGAGMEPWAEDIINAESDEKTVVFEASKYVELLKSHEHEEDDHNHEEFDPHIWLDFENDQKIVEAIKNSYVSLDPDNESVYEINAGIYIGALKDLDVLYKQSLEDCDKDTFVTGGHNAYGYLVKEYDLNFLSIYKELSPNSEPTPQVMKEIVDISKKNEIEYIFFETLMGSRLAEAIAEETDASTLSLNPAQNLTKEEFDQGVTFIDLMEQNLINLQKALECHEK